MIWNVSPHLLMDVRSCGVRGWTRHVMGYTTVGDAIKMKAGQAYHAAMAVYLDPAIAEVGPERRARALKALHAVYDGTWEVAPAEQLDEAYTPGNLHRLFDRWMQLYPSDAQPWKRVIEVETAFVSRAWRVDRIGSGPYDIELNLCPSPTMVDPKSQHDWVQLILRPDALVEDHANFIRYVDTKTTGWHISDPGWMRSLRMNLQTQLYADGVHAKYNERAVLGGWVNACEIKHLPDSNRKCKAHPGQLYSECGPEHAKTSIMSCDTNPENVAKALAEAKRAATTFVKLMIQHREHAPRDRDDAIASDLTDPAWQSYPVASIPNEGTSNDKCRFCPASQWCDESQGVIAALPSFMAYNPWPISADKREHAA